MHMSYKLWLHSHTKNVTIVSTKRLCDFACLKISLSSFTVYPMEKGTFESVFHILLNWLEGPCLILKANPLNMTKPDVLVRER